MSRRLTEEPSWAESSLASPDPRRGPPLAPSPATAIQRCDDPRWDVPPSGEPGLAVTRTHSHPHTRRWRTSRQGTTPAPDPTSRLTLQPAPGGRGGGARIKSPVHRPLRSIIRAFVENQLIRQSAKAVKMIILLKEHAGLPSSQERNQKTLFGATGLAGGFSREERVWPHGNLW